MYDYEGGGRTASDGKFLHGETEFKIDTVIEYKRMFLSLPFEIYPRFFLVDQLFFFPECLFQITLTALELADIAMTTASSIVTERKSVT